MKENIIVAGHALAKYESRRKYSDICEITNKEYKFIYITPLLEYSEIRGTYGKETEFLTKFDTLLKLRSYLSNNHWLYIHNPFKLIKIFNKYRPKLLIIENEPHSFLTIELFICIKFSSFYKNFKSRTVLFSWDNLFLINNFPRYFYKKIVDFCLTRFLDTIICGNKKCLEIFKARGISESKLKNHPQVGIDTKSIQSYDSNSLKKEITIIYCGRLVYEKGLHILIKAHIKILKLGFNIKTTIAGNGHGNYFNYIRNLSKDIKSIKFVPSLSKKQMYDLFSKSTFFVLPSIATEKWAEQFGLTLAEAMASKNCLALGSESGAIPEVLFFKKCLFKENSSESLKNLILYFIKNKKIRYELSKKQVNFARKKYSFKAIANLYAETISNELNI